VTKAQSPAEGDLYDCENFATQPEAQRQLLPGDPYALDRDGDGQASEEFGRELANIVVQRSVEFLERFLSE
jgi:hypothetical protein